MQGSYALYRCAVLSTSTSSLSDILDRDSPIQILHLGVEMEGRVAADGLEVDNAQYCGWRKNHLNEKVRTIPPTQETLSHTFQYLIEQGYHEAIITTLGSRLSDTAEVIRKIAREYKELKIYVVDTGMCCMPEGYFALEALRLLREGKRPPEIITYLERLKPRCNIFFGIPSTRPLVVNGTVARMGARLSDWLGLKTVLRFTDNELSRVGSVSDIDEMMDAVILSVMQAMRGKDSGDFVLAGLYSGSPEFYHHFANRFHNQTGLRLGDGVPVSPVVAVHVGFDCIGIGMVERIKD